MWGHCVHILHRVSTAVGPGDPPPLPKVSLSYAQIHRCCNVRSSAIYWFLWTDYRLPALLPLPYCCGDSSRSCSSEEATLRSCAEDVRPLTRTLLSLPGPTAAAVAAAAADGTAAAPTAAAAVVTVAVAAALRPALVYQTMPPIAAARPSSLRPLRESPKNSTPLVTIPTVLRCPTTLYVRGLRERERERAYVCVCACV